MEMNILRTDNCIIALWYPVRLSTIIRIKVFIQMHCFSISIFQSTSEKYSAPRSGLPLLSFCVKRRAFFINNKMIEIST